MRLAGNISYAPVHLLKQLKAILQPAVGLAFTHRVLVSRHANDVAVHCSAAPL